MRGQVLVLLVLLHHSLADDTSQQPQPWDVQDCRACFSRCCPQYTSALAEDEQEVARLRQEVHLLKWELAVLNAKGRADNLHALSHNSAPPTVLHREDSEQSEWREQLELADTLQQQVEPEEVSSERSARLLSGDAATLSPGNSTEVGDDHGESHEYETLFFLFGAVTLGIGLVHLTTLPLLQHMQFTVALFVIGVVCGAVAERGELSEWAPLLYRSYDSWVSIDPHLLLYTFLPPLLCGDAMTIDTHVAKRCAKQCLWLAGPGVIMGAFSTAAVLYWIVPYNWDLATCVTVGSILAATDPVAVVSLLKDLGASPVLTILIQGESLLNDGIAMVLFTVAYHLAGGGSYTPLRFIVYVLSSTVGAFSLGLAVGLAFYFWIKKANDRFNGCSALIQISLTLACAYWSFILAEGVFHISGVLSTVAAALVLAHRMWPVLVERSAMLEMWHVIETVGNSLVFFLAGALTGHATLYIEVQDLFWSVIVYVACLIIRTVMLLVSKPILGKLGEPVAVQEIAVMSWGGLRGMVGLALAILVQKDLADGHLEKQEGERILFMVGSIAALTLIFNATTCPFLTKVLGITATPQGRAELMRNVARRAHQHLEESMRSMLADPQAVRRVRSPQLVEQLVGRLLEAVSDDSSICALGTASIANMQSFAQMTFPVVPLRGVSGDEAVHTQGFTSSQGFLSSRSAHQFRSAFADRLQLIFARQQSKQNSIKLLDQFEEQRRALLLSGADVVPFQFGRDLPKIKEMLETWPCKPGMLKVFREVFLEAVRTQYWEQLHGARFDGGGSVPSTLFNSVDIAKDKCHLQLADWEVIKSEIKHELVSWKEVSPPPASPTRTSLSTTPVQRASFSSQRSWKSEESHETTPSRSMGLLIWLPSSSILHTYKKWLEEFRRQRHYSRQAHAIQVINSFIDAHLQAQTHIAAFFGETSSIDSAEEAYVVLESQTAVFEAARMRNLVGREVQTRVNTMWEVHRLADTYRTYIVNAYTNGVLLGKEAETVLQPIEKAMRAINKERKKIHALIHKASTSRKPMTQLDAALMIQRHIRNRKKVRNIRRKSVHLTASLTANLAAQLAKCTPMPAIGDSISDCSSSESDEEDDDEDEEEAQSSHGSSSSEHREQAVARVSFSELPQMVPEPCGDPVPLPRPAGAKPLRSISRSTT